MLLSFFIVLVLCVAKPLHTYEFGACCLWGDDNDTNVAWGQRHQCTSIRGLLFVSSMTFECPKVQGACWSDISSCTNVSNDQCKRADAFIANVTCQESKHPDRGACWNRQNECQHTTRKRCRENHYTINAITPHKFVHNSSCDDDPPAFNNDYQLMLDEEEIMYIYLGLGLCLCACLCCILFRGWKSWCTKKTIVLRAEKK